ncbi:MAG TPA: P-loop NTPase fold protein, partial [Chitinolyticbacter sp.]|nr:P-loop NTPase fold protein [Chitinolyticbacter sp.]
MTDLPIDHDSPLDANTALKNDKLGRRSFAESVVRALRRVNSSAGLTIAIEGNWGSGKTSALALLEALLRDEKNAAGKPPLIVHFNPWLVGNREALLRQFLGRIASVLLLESPGEAERQLAERFAIYAELFDVLANVPLVSPWANAGKALSAWLANKHGSAAQAKENDLESCKAEVVHELKRFARPIIVFIDDLDRLPPQEVFEMVRIVKAVGDFPSIGYVLAWDPAYVGEALDNARIPGAYGYLDKLVQLRLPLPVISLSQHQKLVDAALQRLGEDAHYLHFPKDEGRFGLIYGSGLRDVLETPRDIARTFNIVAMIEPSLRGEVALSDLIGLAALMVKAPPVFELLRRFPEYFVGYMPGDEMWAIAKPEEALQAGAELRDKALARCANPRACRELAEYLFPGVGGRDHGYGTH